ncbi:MAG: flippase-like domain-containing protein [Anaerolineae bacterium]|nr:flippase-like domain-containing protein [Phycisphaerae bacterium]
MNPKAKKVIKFVLRWGIAVAGIGWVISNISLYNRVLIANPTTLRPTPVRLAAEARDEDTNFLVHHPFVLPGQISESQVARTELFVKSDRDQTKIRDDNGAERIVEVLGLKVINDPDRTHWPLLVAKPRTFWMKYTGGDWGDRPELISPSRVADYAIRVEYPIIDTGVGPMTYQAFNNHPFYLILAILVFPVTFIITSFRWHMLLKALQIRMSLSRTFVINMVGAFYNTFLPGSTGGDVLKAYYAAKQTTMHRTRAVMSVIIDRIIGLLALVIMGGTAATFQYFTSHQDDPATKKCGQVALGSAAIIGVTILGLVLLYNRTLRRISGLDWVLNRLPMQAQVQKALDTMEIYRQHWLAVVFAILMTLPVHGAVVVSATFAGLAFGLPISPAYYWVAVPVIVLSGSIPISPQGAGVMEFFAILLTRSHGVTISQAFALTMSIRVVQILWNLTGGIFVLKGGFHAPTKAEQHELADDVPDRNPPPQPA